MITDLTELFMIFDELMPATDEEQGVYWLKTKRADGLVITFALSVNESYVDVIIHNTSGIDIVSLSMDKCTEIKVLCKSRKQLEVIYEDERKRCFLSLLGSPILECKSRKW